MDIQIIKKPISSAQLKAIAEDNYGEMAKGVIDLSRNIMALGGELHADAEKALLQDGSKQETLWGFNIYPDKPRDQWLEYTSFINIRPRDGNRSIEIRDKKLQLQVKEAVEGLIQND